MTSAELRSQKTTFVNSVNSALDEYNKLTTSAKSINTYLANTEDTLLNNELFSRSEKISIVATKTITSVSSKLESAIKQIDAEIARLEEQERIARLKAQEESNPSEEAK